MPVRELVSAYGLAEVLLAIATGGALGLLITLLGGGGTLLLFPLLVYVFGQSTAVAAGTSLLAVLGAALVGLVGHWRGGRVHPRVALLFGLSAMTGSIGGTRLHRLVSDRVTTLIFAGVLLATAARMFLHSRQPSKLEPGQIRWGLLVPLGLGTGTLSGFLGVGGGFLIVPGLIMGAHLNVHEAIGTSVAVIVLSTVTGGLAHLAQGSVNTGLAIAIGGPALVGAVAAVPLVARIPARPLRLAFAVMVALIGLGVTVAALS
jgi:uncharacterized protein